MPKTPNAEDEFEGEVGPQRRRMPVERQGLTHKVEIQDTATGRWQEGYITANVNEDGELGEVFLAGFGKAGSTLEGWTQVAAVLFSIAIQYGAELPMLARKLAHMNFPPNGPTNNPEIPHCRSVPDYVLHWLALRFGDDDLRADLVRIDKELDRP